MAPALVVPPQLTSHFGFAPSCGGVRAQLMGTLGDIPARVLDIHDTVHALCDRARYEAVRPELLAEELAAVRVAEACMARSHPSRCKATPAASAQQ